MIFVLVPAYNEAQNLPALVEGLAALLRGAHEPHSFVVVDDGSADGTPALLARLSADHRISVATHPRNLGVGAVFRTGFARLLELASDEDLAVSIEADNTGDPTVFLTMIGRLRAGADIVLASCYAPGGAVKGSNRFRLAISRVANGIIAFLFGLGGIHTYSSFYRGYRVRSLRRAFRACGDGLITRPGFVCMVEMLVKLSRLPLRIEEVPSVLDTDLRKGRSKMKVLRTTISYFKFFAAELFRSRAEGRAARARWEEEAATEKTGPNS